MPAKNKKPIDELLVIMATLRSPNGCPWDKEQTHQTLRQHAIEEVYELLDAIDEGDDGEMAEELGDLLLQVIFHCQLGRERKAFDFNKVVRSLNDKLIRRHPHVFGTSAAKTVDAVWEQWEKIKKSEKSGTARERKSAFDGLPKHLPQLIRAEKLAKRARKLGLMGNGTVAPNKNKIADQLLDLAASAQAQGWSAEELLRDKLRKCESDWRKAEAKAVRARVIN